ncbi:MAG TPA: hypothetical protein VFV38_24350 [Ktedonobacteraceae bacterium]|nr:hypothetical protein [Ktedonobacteraceae bacterium]
MNKDRKQYRSIPLRASKTQEGYALRPSDTLTGTVPAQQTRRTQVAKEQSYVSHRQMPALPDADEQYAPVLSPRSTIRYTDTQGRQVIEQGKRRLVIERVKRPTSRRGFHWLLLFGGGMLLMILLVAGIQWAITGIQAHNIDATYGYPRTWQTDAVVGHHDSPQHPSHFIFQNLQGHVIVIELPGGDIAHAEIYGGPTLLAPDASQIPVTGSFEDINHDGRPDMEMHINGQTIVYLNNGTKFVPQVP